MFFVKLRDIQLCCDYVNRLRSSALVRLPVRTTLLQNKEPAYRYLLCKKEKGVNPIMISKYSKVRIITTGRIGTIVEFDNRKNGAIHLIELTDTDEDDRMVWAGANDLEELPDDEFPPLE